MLRALESRRYLSFSLVRSVRRIFLAEHNQALMGHQDGYSAREAATSFSLCKQIEKNVMSEDINRFDDCKLTNAKLYLNSECYPYDDLNLDFN